MCVSWLIYLLTSLPPLRTTLVVRCSLRFGKAGIQGGPGGGPGGGQWRQRRDRDKPQVVALPQVCLDLPQVRLHSFFPWLYEFQSWLCVRGRTMEQGYEVIPPEIAASENAVLSELPCFVCQLLDHIRSSFVCRCLPWAGLIAHPVLDRLMCPDRCLLRRSGRNLQGLLSGIPEMLSIRVWCEIR